MLYVTVFAMFCNICYILLVNRSWFTLYWHGNFANEINDGEYIWQKLSLNQANKEKNTENG